MGDQASFKRHEGIVLTTIHGAGLLDEGQPRWARWVADDRWIGLIGAGGIATLVLSSAPWQVTNWLLTHWTFRYSDGLRQRALIGSLVGWLAENPVSERTVLVASGMLIALFAAGGVWLVVRAWAQQATLVTAVAGMCLLAAPGTLPLIALDVGRFDVIGLNFLVLGLAVVVRSRPPVSLFLIAVLGGVGVAVHEAVLVAQLPLMVTAWWITAQPGPRRGAIMVATSLVPAAAVMAWVHAGGRLSGPQTESALGRASDHITGGFVPSPSAMEVHTRGVEEMIAHTWFHVASLESLLHRGVALAACAPALLVGWHLLKRFGRRGHLLAAASLGPMPLFVVGQDWGRWMALITLNTLIAALWLSGDRQQQPLATVETWKRVLLVAAAAVSMLLPPINHEAGGLHANWYWELVRRL